MISKAEASALLDLFSTLQRARGWTDKQMYASLDLGPAKARLLEYIAVHDATSQTELARATDTDKALTERSVEAFLENGWVRRQRSRDDGRAYILSLSPSGRKIVKQFETIRGQILGFGELRSSSPGWKTVDAISGPMSPYRQDSYSRYSVGLE